ncbi:MAG: PqqD family protein [Bacteroidales bacterium]|nr:PqqD family protein [Bacteroidales bacterium]
MKLKENIAVSKSGFLFDPDSGESFSVNSTGKEILQYLSKGMSISEIESSIFDEYEVEQKTFRRYMDDFAHTLRRFNLLENEVDE